MDALPWYKTFFGEDYLQIYTFLTPERTEREVDGIVTLLNLPTASSILDLCCGHGRHAIALARRGYQVTGLDLSKAFLQHAQAGAEHQGVQVRWVEGDMRKIPFESAFDAIINIFTAFGYLHMNNEKRSRRWGRGRAAFDGVLLSDGLPSNSPEDSGTHLLAASFFN